MRRVLALTIVLLTTQAWAQQPEPISAQLVIRADTPGPTINRHIYGHFAEHLGRCIYDGIWVGENSPIPNTNGIRNDIIAALKQLQIPNLRWPGGCFADEYHWKDGIGPRNQRPKRINTHWGMVVENNHFGTHEFFELCELIGADAYLSANVGTGTPREMMEWIEYITCAEDTTLAAERRKNGRERPWKLPFVAVGNESWGCGGNMTAAEYATQYRQFQTFVKEYSGNTLQKIACGASDGDYQWTETLMTRAGRLMNGLSLHHYTLPTGSWRGSKGSATNFQEDQWHSTMFNAWRMDEFVKGHAQVMDRSDPQKRVGLVVDEWGTWYDVEPGTNPGFLYQHNTVRDAVVAGMTLNIFNNHADRISMANLAQTVNVLQAVILTERDKMILTPTYHAMEMYKVHQGGTLLPSEITTPDYTMANRSVPVINVSSSRDASGKIHVSLVNAEPNRPATVTMRVTGKTGARVTGRVLTGPAMNTMNTFDQPETVKPAAFSGAQVQGEQIMLTLPAKSVVVLEVQ